jgi:hypothetical protein
MSRRWFSRVGLELDSEKVDITVRTLNDVKINTQRVLTAEDTQTYLINNLTIGLNNGATITSMTIEGVAANPDEFYVQFCKAGSIGMLYIPAFSITAIAGGTPPTQATINGVPFPLQPTTPTYVGLVGINNGDDWGGRFWIDTSNNIHMKGFRLGADVDYVVPFGNPYTTGLPFRIQ